MTSFSRRLVMTTPDHDSHRPVATRIDDLELSLDGHRYQLDVRDRPVDGESVRSGDRRSPVDPRRTRVPGRLGAGIAIMLCGEQCVLGGNASFRPT